MPVKDKIDEIDLRSESVQDIMSMMPHWMIRYGNTIFASIFIIILAFSWFIKYPDIITADVIITTQIPPQKEYAKTDGRIDRLLINDNETVKKGEFIAVLDNPARFKDIVLLKSVMDTIKFGSPDISFPFEELPTLSLGELASDYALFLNSYLQYKLNKELEPFINIGTALEKTQNELLSRLNVMEGQRKIMVSELSYKKKDLERYKALYEGGVVSIQELEVKQMEYLQSQRNLKNIDISISRLRENITTIGKDNRANAITQDIEELNLYSETLQAFNQLKKSLREWELNYAFISNIEGKVSFINVWNENQFVKNGDLIFTIVPSSNSSYIARLKTPAQNIGKVIVGQRVNIRLQNYPAEEFGVLPGKVKNISLLPNNEGFYVIEVGLADRLITSYGKEIEFSQEMTGAAEIITEELRLLERFFYQLRGLLSRS